MWWDLTTAMRLPVSLLEWLFSANLDAPLHIHTLRKMEKMPVWTSAPLHPHRPLVQELVRTAVPPAIAVGIIQMSVLLALQATPSVIVLVWPAAKTPPQQRRLLQIKHQCCLCWVFWACCQSPVQVLIYLKKLVVYFLLRRRNFRVIESSDRVQPEISLWSLIFIKFANKLMEKSLKYWDFNKRE